ncbi:Type I restriction modification DNA specificity domain protein, partial [Haemophilus influenzae]
MLTKELM